MKKKGFQCSDWVVEQVCCDFVDLICIELKDFWVGMISLMVVELILDYVYVKVFFVMFNDEYFEEVECGLKCVVGFLCCELGW